MGTGKAMGKLASGGGGRPSLVASYAWQLYALTYKNWVLFRRQWISSLVQLLAPALFVVLFGLVVGASNSTPSLARDPPPLMSMGGTDGDTLGNRCVVFDAVGGRFGFGMPIKNHPCITVAYSPKSAQVDAIMEELARQNGLVMEEDVRGFADSTALVNYFGSDDAIPLFTAVVFNNSGSLFMDVPTETGPQGEAVDRRTKLPLGSEPATSVLAYEIWYNKTVAIDEMLVNAGLDDLLEKSDTDQSYVLQVQRAVSAAILGAHTGSDTAGIKLDIKPFPQVEGDNVASGSRPNDSFFTVEQFGGLFYLAGVMMTFVVTLRQIVQEKEDKILDALRMMGLYESCYWLSWTLFHAVVSFVAANLMVLAGTVMNVTVFQQTTGSWMVCTLFSYLMAMSAFSMAVSTIVSTTKVAVMAGFLLMVLALVFQLVVSVQLFSILDLLYSQYRLSAGALSVINLYPPILFAKVEYMMFGMTKDRVFSDPTTQEESIVKGTYTWEDAANGLYQYANPVTLEAIDRTVDYAELCSTEPSDSCYVQRYRCGSSSRSLCEAQQCTLAWEAAATKEVCESVGGAVYLTGSSQCRCLFSIPSDMSSILAMYGSVVFWVVMAWYLGQVWTFGHGRAERPWFPFTPWYWLSSFGVKNPFASAGAKPLLATNETKDADVDAEERAVAAGERSDQARYPVVLSGLVRDFGGGICGQSFRAVNGLTLALEKGSCFVMLGHNGAGKTTAINMLSGMIAPSGGDCTIYGKSVRDSIGSIRHDIGVCPQHDILWPQLTAREHLRFFGHFQGMGLRQVREQGKYLLKQVRLDKLSRVAGTFSGGMRRRLSMAIASLGNKLIVFLDEPTTGLDPQNQRRVWDMINELKKDRVVILTTHLMDEADVLGDRIGIMSKGRLVALGNPLHLKSKFGSNYKITVSPADESGARQRLVDSIRKTLHNAEVDPESAANATGPLVVTIRPTAFKDAARLFRRIDEIIAQGGAKDWGLSQTSLEDVFFSLDEQEKAVLSTCAAGHKLRNAKATALDMSVPIEGTDGNGDDKAEFAEDIAFHDSLGGQVRALFRKSVALQLRQRKTVCCQTSIPLLLVAALGVLLIVLEKEFDASYSGGDSFFGYNPYFRACSSCLLNNVEEMDRLVNAGDESLAPPCGMPSCAIGRFANLSEIPSSYTTAYRDLVPGLVGSNDFRTIAEFEDLFGAGSVAKTFNSSNPFYSHCVNDDPSLRCSYFDESQRLSRGKLLSEPALWFGSDFVDEDDRFDPVSGDSVYFGSRLIFGASTPAIAAALGSRCVSSIRPEQAGLLAMSNGTIVFECAGSFGTNYITFPMEKRYLSFDESFNARGTLSCRFPNATAAQETMGPILNAASVNGGILARYPAGVRQTNIVTPDSAAVQTSAFWSTVDICPVSSLSRYGNLSAELRDDNNAPAAVNEMLILAQEDYRDARNEFEIPVPRTRDGYLAAAKILGESFPEAALFFSELDLAKGRVALTLQTYINDPDFGNLNLCSAQYLNAGVDMGKTNENERRSCGAQFIPVARSVEVENHRIKHTSIVNNVLNGVVSALLRSAPAAASSPLTGAGNVEVAVGTRPFPYGAESEMEDERQRFLTNIYTVTGSVLVPLATSFLLPVFVFHIVHEKENKLRANMLMMGLRMRAYWSVQYAFDMTLAAITLGLCYVVGMALGAPIFANHQFGIVLVLLLLWANAQVGLAFFLSVFFSRTGNANIVLYLFVLASAIAGLIFNLNVFSMTPYLPAPGWFVWFPPFAYCRGVFLLSKRSYFWEDLDASDEMVKIWGYLTVQAAVCFAATFYLDVVLPNEFGVRRGPFFPIEDLFAAVRAAPKGVDPESAPERLELDLIGEDSLDADLGDDDPDVAHERRLVLAESPEVEDAPIRILNLKKQFGAFQAVDGLTMHMKDRSLTSLLGANGAGKSTTISTLTGLFRPSGGNAFVDGKSIRTEMHKVYQVIGVCPQHDVTWPELTVKEHLLFYARLKGASRADEFRVVHNAIAAVQLTGHESKRARQLSGGQRRRLSIAISFLGNPRVVFLDEPTTGVDPVTRSHVHELVLREKTKRCIVLTTHLMSESEKLSDRIAIMGQGRLKAIGTASALKTKYNEGFKLILVVTDEAAARAFVAVNMPGAALASKVNATVVYRFDSAASMRLADVWEIMQGRSGGDGISDWQISATTLEDVFVQIAAII